MNVVWLFGLLEGQWLPLNKVNQVQWTFQQTGDFIAVMEYCELGESLQDIIQDSGVTFSDSYYLHFYCSTDSVVYISRYNYCSTGCDTSKATEYNTSVYGNPTSPPRHPCVHFLTTFP